MGKFRYFTEIGESGALDHTLGFRARTGAPQIEGCDFVDFDEDGVIDELYVVFRALCGLPAMAEAMRRSTNDLTSEVVVSRDGIAS